MPDDAPITWLVGRINQIVNAGAGSVATGIASTITPLVSVCFGIYILLITINYMRGAESEPVLDFGLRCANFAIVIGLGLHADTYISTVMPVVTGLGADLANAVSGGSVSEGSLDQLAIWYLDIIANGFTSAGEYSGFRYVGMMVLVLAKSIIIMVGLIPFLAAATLTIIVANVGSVLVAMVGPLFFAFLLFPATRQYFSAWLNTAFSYALIPMMVAVIATISVQLSKEMLSSGVTLDRAEFSSVFFAAIGNLILLFLLKQVASLASSLSAGGINAAMPGGIGSAARTMGSSIRGTAREIKGAAQAYKKLSGKRPDKNEIKAG